MDDPKEKQTALAVVSLVLTLAWLAAGLYALVHLLSAAGWPAGP